MSITIRGSVMKGEKLITVGQMLEERFMKPMGISINALAKHTGVAAATINNILINGAGISVKMADKLACTFDTSIEFWMDLDQREKIWEYRNYYQEQIKEWSRD